MIIKRIKELRKIMAELNCAGYLISTTDEFLSEYAPDSYKRLEYITGFTGSNGFAIIMLDKILFFTDGRYLTQAAAQLDQKQFEIFDLANIRIFDFSKYFSDNDKIFYDPKIFTKRFLNFFPKKLLKSHPHNLVDIIWDDQPASPSSTIYSYDIKYAGESRESKIQKCQDFIKENKAAALLITDSSATCWLLNIRGHDIEFTPLVLTHVLVTKDEVTLFADPTRLKSNIAGIIIKAMSELEVSLGAIKGTILYDPLFSTEYINSFLSSKKHKTITDPCQLWKAIKNKTELEYIKKGHIEDAVAVIETIAKIESLNEAERANFSEYDVGLMLSNYRSQREGYVMDSFPAICGYQSNGAIIHYRAEQETAKKLSGKGLLLIDSGGQYAGATTDITRTIAIGPPTEEQIASYTDVLKGHIDLVLCKFPKDKVTGANLDVLARGWLWKNGKDYAHGTGHGVGAFLSVHEGPHNISLLGSTTQIQAGMVMSNEPGYYVPGKYGIRIENMMYVKESVIKDYLEFEMITLVPYCKALIDLSKLDAEHIEYLSNYSKKISQLVAPKLSRDAANWLERALF